MIVSKFGKRVAMVNCAVPALLLAWDAARGGLGANPVNFAIRTTGLLALIFLIISLSVTPAMRLSGWSWLGTFRRTAGVSAFAYAALHFSLYFSLDRAGRLGDTLAEIGMRRFLLVGMVALLLMLPLAVTSTDRMIRRLGGKRWKRLHRLAYLAALLGGLHFLMLVKADTTRPVVVLTLFVGLLAWRMVAHYQQLQRDSFAFRNRPPIPVTKARSWTGPLRVARIFAETPNVRTFRFVPPNGGPLPFDHEPGQYLILSLTIDGQQVRRSYTMASPPSRHYAVEVTVKREDKGLVSRHLHDHIREGDTLTVTAPAGRFTFVGHEAPSLLMIAGGVGITPLMAMLRHLTDCGWPRRIHLLVSARTEAELIFRDEIDTLQRRHPNVTASTTLTRESASTWMGRRGRIDASLLQQLLADHPNGRIHLCGPTEMTAPLIATLQQLGVMAERIHEESFASPSREDASTPVETFDATAATHATLRFATSGRTATELRGRTILEIAEAEGVALPFDCRAAVCGQCKTRVLSGTVVMDAEDALDERDRAAGVVLACQARCQDAVVIDA